ncbi:MAG: glycine cleavage system protein T [Acidimicrobiia bacterium]|nr:glycine cleavage system protein T [Acidimicrobiia bacterium]
MYGIGRSPRLRPSPYFEATIRAGVEAFTTYNHMLLPMRYTSTEDEYESLIHGVTIWDVAAQRQVEIEGPDAAALTQYLCTRDVSRIKPGQARYTFMCNYQGGVINDPVLLKLAEDHFWLSLADRDILLWVQAVAAERGFDAKVREPDVAPLQVQGPLSGDLIGDVFGSTVRDQKYYHFVELEHEGVPLVVSRTGWSGEFGYEVFLRDSSKGEWLWELLFAAGAKYGVKPAAPNQIRRIEGGILSCGTDTDDSVTPLELGFDRLVQFESESDFIGRAALAAQKSRGVERRLTGFRFGGEPLRVNSLYLDVSRNGERVGRVTSIIYSPRFEANIGFAMVGAEHAEPGTELEIHLHTGTVAAIAEAIPFVDAIKSS